MYEGVKPILKRSALAVPFLFLAAGLTAQQGDPTDLFRHETHRDVACDACHNSVRGGEDKPQLTLANCRSCHHAEPASSVCEQCHAPADARVIAQSMERTMDIQVGTIDRPTRALPMRHSSHDDVRCQSCHTEGLGLSARNVECSSCHEAHHRPVTRCQACHEQPADWAHDREVHLGCGGAGCHESAPANIRMVPRTRAFCLVCHSDMAYHKPDQACADCHLLPPPRAEGQTGGR